MAEDKMKLFAVYLGGKADGCNIEAHDVVFVVGTTIEQTYPLLVKKWFGNQNHVHIDSYLELQNVDGYQIDLSKELVDNTSNKLYFINFGGYKAEEFIEYHQNGFYVAESVPEAIKKARSELCKGLNTVHKDDVVLVDKVGESTEYDVDDVLEIEQVDEYFVSLKPTTSNDPLKPVSKYIKMTV